MRVLLGVLLSAMITLQSGPAFAQIGETVPSFHDRYIKPMLGISLVSVESASEKDFDTLHHYQGTSSDGTFQMVLVGSNKQKVAFQLVAIGVRTNNRTDAAQALKAIAGFCQDITGQTGTDLAREMIHEVANTRESAFRVAGNKVIHLFVLPVEDGMVWTVEAELAPAKEPATI